jgi:hypothetical protein
MYACRVSGTVVSIAIFIVVVTAIAFSVAEAVAIERH